MKSAYSYEHEAFEFGSPQNVMSTLDRSDDTWEMKTEDCSLTEYYGVIHEVRNGITPVRTQHRYGRTPAGGVRLAALNVVWYRSAIE